MAAERQAAALAAPVAQRVAALDWSALSVELDAFGCAATGPLLTAGECAMVVATYESEALFRSRVVMARHGFGQGEYKYFAYPLPPLIADLRTAFYPRLARVAARWDEMLGLQSRYPNDHAGYLERCHAAGQVKPTPLLLRYGRGDFNCLHQDLYGEHAFPLQLTILLSAPGADFNGGEFVLTEQRPRMQTRAQVVPLRQGEAAIFAVNQRPVAGSRGAYKVAMRHGVSRIRSGHRYTLGIIFHDAR